MRGVGAGFAIAVCGLPALAQPRPYVSPKPVGDWAVQRQTGEGGDADRCVAILDGDDDSSIAYVVLDASTQVLAFVRPRVRLRVQRVYDIVLRVDQAAPTTLTGIAPREDTVAAPVEDEKRLLRTMRDGGLLSVEVDGQRFGFHLDDFAPAMDEAAKCAELVRVGK